MSINIVHMYKSSLRFLVIFKKVKSKTATVIEIYFVLLSWADRPQPADFWLCPEKKPKMLSNLTAHITGLSDIFYTLIKTSKLPGFLDLPLDLEV